MAQVLALGITAATTAYSANAQLKAGKAQQAIADRNAALLEDQAQDVVTQGLEEGNRIKRRARELKGEQRTSAAAQGIDINSSVVDSVEYGADASAFTDAEIIRQNAWREAYGIRKQAEFRREEGLYARKNARNEAIATTLGGASSMAAQYYNWQASKDAAKAKN